MLEGEASTSWRNLIRQHAGGRRMNALGERAGSGTTAPGVRRCSHPRCARDSTIAQAASAIGRARSPRARALASLAVPASTRPMIPCAMAESLNIENAT